MADDMNDQANLNQGNARQRARNVPVAAISPRTIARGLGWFSIALGTAEIVAARAVSRSAGLESSAALVRLYGLRELACGIGILASGKAAPFLWARLGGDVLDIGTIVAQSDMSNPRNRNRAFLAIANVLGVTALDVYTARGLYTEPSTPVAQPVRDYSGRSGFPRAAESVCGAALADFQIPKDGFTKGDEQPRGGIR
jgi:hypothetical protein